MYVIYFCDFTLCVHKGLRLGHFSIVQFHFEFLKLQVDQYIRVVYIVSMYDIRC